MRKYKLYIILIIAGISFFFFISFLTRNYVSEKNNEYKEISFNDNIKGVLENVGNNRGTLYIDLNKSVRFSISSATCNYNYTQPCIRNFLNIGDSIVKTANTDTIYIIRGNKTFFFIINGIIGNPAGADL